MVGGRARTRQGKLTMLGPRARARLGRQCRCRARTGGALLGLTAGQGTGMEARGGEDFGTVTENEASPLPLNKALRKLKSLWSNFAIIAKSALRL